VLLWTLSIAAALLLSYLIANRITRPIDSLVAGVEEFGRGNYEFRVSTDAHGEIGALARSFDAMRRSLKQTQTALLRSERLATIGQMASSIVHDLRNPLATITTAAEMLARDGIAHERRQTLIESQLRASDRMNEMLRELLEFSLGSYKLNLGRHSLAAIVERAIRELKPGIGRAGVEVEVHVPEHFRVQADDERLRRVFENLLINAAQAMTDGGQITITADYFPESRDQVRVAVIDNGPGVPAEVRERVFEPFVSYGKSGGTGLGLAIAQRVVAAHGGEIGLKSSEASGSEFYLVLPLDPDEQGVET
jgi:signal transduction histidine kinase